MDLARLLRERLRNAMKDTDGGLNIAISANVDESGHSTIVTNDGDVTIVERDGECEVIHHRRSEPNGE